VVAGLAAIIAESVEQIKNILAAKPTGRGSRSLITGGVPSKNPVQTLIFKLRRFPHLEIWGECGGVHRLFEQ